MESTIRIKNENQSLNNLLTTLNASTSYDCSEEYDIWEQRTNASGQLEKCVVLKKSSMHGMKVYFQQDNVLKMSYIIPDKTMNAILGKSQKARRNIIEILTGTIKQAVLAGSQKKAFEELEQAVIKAVS